MVSASNLAQIWRQSCQTLKLHVQKMFLLYFGLLRTVNTFCPLTDAFQWAVSSVQMQSGFAGTLQLEGKHARAVCNLTANSSLWLFMEWQQSAP